MADKADKPQIAVEVDDAPPWDLLKGIATTPYDEEDEANK
jgi:hypothetical protein